MGCLVKGDNITASLLGYYLEYKTHNLCKLDDNHVPH